MVCRCSFQLLMPECCSGTPLIRNLISLSSLHGQSACAWKVVSQLADLIVHFLALSKLFWGGLFKALFKMSKITHWGELWECTNYYFVNMYSIKNVGIEWKIQVAKWYSSRGRNTWLFWVLQAESDYKSLVSRNISGHLSCVIKVNITEFLSSIGRI